MEYQLHKVRLPSLLTRQARENRQQATGKSGKVSFRQADYFFLGLFPCWPSSGTQLLCNSTFWLSGGPRRPERRPEVSIFPFLRAKGQGILDEEIIGEGLWG